MAKLPVRGDRLSKDFRYLKFKLLACLGGPAAACHPKEKVLNYLNNKKMQVVYIDTTTDVTAKSRTEII